MDQSGKKDQSGLGISFSLKRRRALIYRATLKEIGEPSYIRLLVNRKQKRMAVQSCEEIDRESYEVPSYDSWEQFEIASIKLIAMFYKMAGWNQEKSYRIYGYPVKKYHLVLFCLEDGTEITDDEFETGRTAGGNQAG